MGIDIDLHVVDYADLMRRLREAGATDADRVNQILDACGHRIGDKYVILNNEYYDGGSPYYALFNLLDAAFGITGVRGTHDAFRKTPGWCGGVSSIDRRGAAEELGITLPDDD